MAEQAVAVRLIDELGRIVLPVEARRVMDWGEKTPVEIRVNATKNENIIRQHTLYCVYCGEQKT
jgi:transcriptional pleiotropic regulator of transition state genes